MNNYTYSFELCLKRLGASLYIEYLMNKTQLTDLLYICYRDKLLRHQ